MTLKKKQSGITSVKEHRCRFRVSCASSSHLATCTHPGRPLSSRLGRPGSEETYPLLRGRSRTPRRHGSAGLEGKGKIDSVIHYGDLHGVRNEQKQTYYEVPSTPGVIWSFRWKKSWWKQCVCRTPLCCDRVKCIRFGMHSNNGEKQCEKIYGGQLLICQN